jgi:hypothetical protein
MNTFMHARCISRAVVDRGVLANATRLAAPVSLSRTTAWHARTMREARRVGLRKKQTQRVRQAFTQNDDVRSRRVSNTTPGAIRRIGVGYTRTREIVNDERHTHATHHHTHNTQDNTCEHLR